MPTMIHEQTIEQLGGRQFRSFTGVKKFFAGTDSLSFSTFGMKIKITLTPSDLYTMSVTKGKKVTEEKEIFADDLRGMFENMTGLVTSFHPL